MTHHQEDAEYMADEYEMDDVDDYMDDEFRGRDIGGSDSDADEHDYTVCSHTKNLLNHEQMVFYLYL